MKKSCLTCRYNNSEIVAPGGWIREYKHWILEHINEPVPILGWLVLKTKRHTEGIDGMNDEEAMELGEILNIVPKLQKKVCRASRIYVICFTETVAHLHIHLIPHHIGEKRKGPELFNLVDIVKKDKTKAINVQKSIKISIILKEKLS